MKQGSLLNPISWYNFLNRYTFLYLTKIKSILLYAQSPLIFENIEIFSLIKNDIENPTHANEKWSPVCNIFRC